MGRGWRSYTNPFTAARGDKTAVRPFIKILWPLVIRSTLLILNRPNKVGLKCPSVRSQKVSSISVKFGMYVEVDEWCTMVCSMTRSKVKVTSPWKLENPSIFESYLRHLQWEPATDRWFWNYGTISKCDWAGFLIFVLFVCVTWLWTWRKRQLRRVDRHSRTRG